MKTAEIEVAGKTWTVPAEIDLNDEQYMDFKDQLYFDVDGWTSLRLDFNEGDTIYINGRLVGGTLVLDLTDVTFGHIEPIQVFGPLPVFH